VFNPFPCGKGLKKTGMFFCRDDDHCDAVIKVEGHEFRIHKSMFALYFDSFQTTFTVEVIVQILLSNTCRHATFIQKIIEQGSSRLFPEGHS